MTLPEHTALSIPFAGITYAATFSSTFALIAAAASILIDMDHVSDYLLETRRWFKPLGVFAFYREGQFSRIFLLLHSWELVAILLITGYQLEQAWVMALGTGFAFHIAMDTLCWCVLRSRVTPLLYFFGYRLSRRFSADRILKRNPGSPQENPMPIG